jgi:hypothetical protein
MHQGFGRQFETSSGGGMDLKSRKRGERKRRMRDYEMIRTK